MGLYEPLKDIKMKYQLRINHINFKEPQPDNWWKTKTHLSTILKTLFTCDILPLNYLYQDRYKRIMNLENTIDECNKLGDDIKFGFSLTSSNIDNINNSISIHPTKESVGILLVVDSTTDNFNKMVRFLWSLYEDLKDFAYFGPNVVISSFMHKYPKYRPEKYYGNLWTNAIFNFLHKSFYSKNQNTMPKGFERLFDAPLPDGVSRKIAEDIVAIQWTENVADEEGITNALMQREEWIYNHLNLELDSDFNIDGDKKLYNISTVTKLGKEESFLNYYREPLQVAFKLIVLDENIELDQETRDKITHYNKTKQLDNGALIKKIVLILPSRKFVSKISSEAKELGVFKVVYLDNEANIWDMTPAGNWRN